MFELNPYYWKLVKFSMLFDIQRCGKAQFQKVMKSLER